MRILQIHNRYLHYGGEDKVVDIESELLIERGVEVRQLIFDNSSFQPLHLFYNKKAYARVYDELAAFKPDVVHVHNIFYTASPSVLNAAQDAGVPVIMTLHNFRLLCTAALFLRDGTTCTKCKDILIPVYGIKHKCFQGSLLKSTALSAFIGWQKIVGTWQRKVDRFIVLTPFIKELLSDSSLKLPPEKIVVKPNSTDDMAQRFQSSTMRDGYVYIGRLSEEKGADIMIEACNRLGLKLSVIGDGPLEARLREIAGVSIQFYGRQNKVFIQNILLQSKAMLFPSICYEGLPNTILEAFSAGTPVIASDMDNINSIVTPGINGVLFEPGDPSAMIEALKEFETRDTIELQYGARKTFETMYTHEENFKKLYSVYQSVL